MKRNSFKLHALATLLLCTFLPVRTQQSQDSYSIKADISTKDFLAAITTLSKLTISPEARAFLNRTTIATDNMKVRIATDPSTYQTVLEMTQSVNKLSDTLAAGIGLNKETAELIKTLSKEGKDLGIQHKILDRETTNQLSSLLTQGGIVIGGVGLSALSLYFMSIGAQKNLLPQENQSTSIHYGIAGALGFSLAIALISYSGTLAGV